MNNRTLSDGIRRAAMIASTPNRTRVMVKGGGAHLPALGSGASAPLPLRVQLVNDANATCFEATFDADAVISLTGEVLEASR